MVNLSIYFGENDNEDFKKLREIARREGVSMGEVIRKLTKDYIKKHGDGNPNFALEKFQDPDFRPFPTLGEILYPAILGKYTFDNLNEIAQAARARAQEIRHELKRRGEPFPWNL